MSGESGRAQWPAWWQMGVVLLACAAVYWPRLGATGFSSTEGHRVIPGWTMLEQGGWMLPKLFGQVYLRKPPGMAWAVAGSAAVFGESEFSARAVSALASTGLALISLVFGARWFGRRHGIAAGLAAALMPAFWAPGRSAEIEALNNFVTGAAVLLLLDLLIAPPGRRRRMAVGIAVIAGVAMAAAALVKGPAGFAAIGMAVVWGLRGTGFQPANRSEAGGEDSGELRAEGHTGWEPVPPGGRAPPWGLLAIAVVVAALIVGAFASLIARAVHFSGQEPVMQGVSEFLWAGNERSVGGVARVLVMPVLALASGLPGSLALVFPWGRDAAADTGADARGYRIARAVAGASVSSLALLMVLGVHNPRYALPSLSFVPVLAAYVARGWGGAFAATRRRIAGWLMLGHPAAWPILLLLSAGVYIGVVEPRQRSSSGRDAGVWLAAALPDRVFAWADGLVEARPEVLLYAQRAGAAEGKSLRFVWVPGMAMADRLSLPRLGDYIILRTDAEGDEAGVYRSAGFMDRLEPVVSGTVHKYAFTVYRMVRPKS